MVLKWNMRKYSDLREVGRKMRKIEKRPISTPTDPDIYRAALNDFYAYKAKEEPEVISCNGSCC